MSILSILAKLSLDGAIHAAGNEIEHMMKDGRDDPVYKAKLQELIERNKAFEVQNDIAGTDK
jgi:hypothetical protein